MPAYKTLHITSHNVSREVAARACLMHCGFHPHHSHMTQNNRDYTLTAFVSSAADMAESIEALRVLLPQDCAVAVSNQPFMS